jgi:ketosteroid isomerase-like protein
MPQRARAEHEVSCDNRPVEHGIGEQIPDEMELLRRLYDRFNARDMDALLSAMHEEVVWANGMEGGYVHGREEVRSYWTRQWTMIDPHVEPTEFSRSPDGEVIVEVHQIVRDLNGKLLADRMVCHVFRFEERLVKVFDIRNK